jgi:hypothetical protein
LSKEIPTVRKTAFSLLALALLLAGAHDAAAQEAKPVAVLSVAGYDHLMADLNYLGQVTDNPDLAENLDGMIKFFTQGQGIRGLDKKQPWGLAVFASESDFKAIAFLPVTDLRQLLGSLAGLLPVEPEDAGDGVLEIQGPQGDSAFIKHQGNWAYLAQAKDHLADVPADPVKLLDGLNEQYDIALRGYVQNIPEIYRQMAIEQMRSAARAADFREEGEDDAAYELRRAMAQRQIKQLESLINEISTITLGWTIDSQARRTYLEVGVTAVPGTKTAAQFAGMTDTTSDYAGFLMPGSAVNLHFSGKASPEDVEQTVLALKAMRARAESEIDNDPNLPDPQLKAAAKEVLGDFITILQRTIESGKMDGGALLRLQPEALSLVAGGYVVDGAAVESAIKKLVELAKNEPGFPSEIRFNFNAGTHGGLTLHSVQIPVPDPNAVRFLGDQLEVYLATGGQSVYLALGKNSLDLLKEAIDKNAAEVGSTVAPMQMTVSLAPIFKFAAAVEPNPMVEMLAEELAKAGGKDRILITARTVPQGVAYRIEAEEAVLKLIGQVGRLAGAGLGGGF